MGGLFDFGGGAFGAFAAAFALAADAARAASWRTSSLPKVLLRRGDAAGERPRWDRGDEAEALLLERERLLLAAGTRFGDADGVALGGGERSRSRRWPLEAAVRMRRVGDGGGE